jgi:RNA polymerase sigma-70 factor (ECF subfamily)
VGQLYAMTGDQAEAQDAVQEAFVRAWARRSKIDRDHEPEAWVRVTA